MNLRLKTNSYVEELLVHLQSSLQFSSRAAVMRLAIGFSLRCSGDPRDKEGVIQQYDIKNQNGQDYNRFTILGNDDIIFKILLSEHLGKKISDDEFFPELVNSHIERGIKILNSEYRYAPNRDKFYENILGLKRG